MLSHDDPRFFDPEFDDAGNPQEKLRLHRCSECLDLVPEVFEHNERLYCQNCLEGFPECEWCNYPCTPEEGSRLRVESDDILPCYPHTVDGWLHTACAKEWIQQFGGD